MTRDGKNLKFLNAELLFELSRERRFRRFAKRARISRLAASDCGIDLIVSIRACSDL